MHILVLLLCNQGIHNRLQMENILRHFDEQDFKQSVIKLYLFFLYAFDAGYRMGIRHHGKNKIIL